MSASHLVLVVDVTFWRKPLGKALRICTVIVDHVIVLNPFQLPLVTVIKRLPEPTIVVEVRIWSIARSYGTVI